MPNRIGIAILSAACAVSVCFVSCAGREKAPAIIIARDAVPLERIAASELRRYLYLRIGELPRFIEKEKVSESEDNVIVLSQKGLTILRGLTEKEALDHMPELDPDDYWLKTFSQGTKKFLLIAGGNGPGLLYGVYDFLERLGIRFYLEGDVVPDEKIARFEIPGLDEIGRPLFKVRGIQPFHDFPEGPDWWSLENYKAILGQLPKLRMNFFGLHTYPEKGPNAEPTVWIGSEADIEPVGRVKFSYPSSYQNTLRGNWGYEAKKTGGYHFGASRLFERDDYGNDVMEDMAPEPTTPEDSNEVFYRAAAVFRNAFSFARKLGVMTCVGTETPLTIPELVKKRLEEAKKSPKDPAVVKEIYKGIFSRIASAYPIDYYWFWTSEGWTWDDAPSEAIKSVTTDLEQAVAAHKESGAPFSLATCGWVLGPPSNRELFDQVLSKTVAMSTINREVGKAPVDPGFARIEGRSTWAIPWMEDDPSLTSPQLWAGRMRRDAADALRYGCEGLLGIHWRTRILSPNVLSLARAAWDQSWSTLAPNLEEETGPITGQYVSFGDKDIAGTDEDAVYRDVRDRVFAYYLPLPDGRYTVTLKFCEGEINKNGRRLFDVVLQGKKAAEKVDIFGAVGQFKAYDLSFPNIDVTGGRLAIEFADRIHYPSLAGIVIRGERFAKKINCGGPAVLDYEADAPETVRHWPSLDFYRDWAENQFGKPVAEEAAQLFSKLDGKLPIPVNWTNGPGGIVPNPKPWEDVRKDYAFVDEMAALGSKVVGKGSRERFAYWLKNFEYMREVSRFNCLWAEYNAAVEKAKAENTAESRAKRARETALPIRVRMVASVRKVFGYLLETVSNTGEMGTIMNWEQHNLPGALERPGEELAKLIGADLPADALPAGDYDGPPRIFVTAQRTSLEPGEVLTLKVIILSKNKPQDASLYWRELGKGPFQPVPLTPMARGVYTVVCPAKDIDLEYYLKATADGQEVYFPSTAPDLNQTVVVFR